jgi:molecular chaperone DnaK
MLKTHAVGIDLGTTYSCISYLNEHGEPVTLANQEGELSTPSVVLFDSDEIVVGTEALRNAVVKPENVVQNSKRFMGDAKKRWSIGGKTYSPTDIAAIILNKLLKAAENQIGKIEQAVITVPAQFSDLQRQATVEAGKKAGLKRIDFINEPVAAALCYVLGTEGLWFTELADEQRIMVYDLGGGTFDLSLVSYQKNEVNVIASSGDLHLGGIDWNRTLLDAIAKQFVKEFKTDPRKDPQSLQFLALEVENAKRSLTVRPKAALTCQHSGSRKSYQVEQAQFESLTKKLVDRTCDITQQMLKDNKMGWAHVDVILTVGGSSRMPMIRNGLKKLGGRTLNTSLSPDQSISHGATYYAGMLLTNSDFAKSILNEEASARLASIKQQSVNARDMGILVRDKNDKRIPHYLIPANTPLPVSVSQTFGTVQPNQKRVHLRIVESGTIADQQFVELGTCVIDDLSPNLPEDSQIEVTISYDEQAQVHVSAKDLTGGKQATTQLVREDGVVRKDVSADETGWQADEIGAVKKSASAKAAAASGEVSKVSKTKFSAKKSPAQGSSPKPVKPKASSPAAKSGSQTGTAKKRSSRQAGNVQVGDTGTGALDSVTPVPLCNDCGEPLDHKGRCSACKPGAKKAGAPRVSVRPRQKPAPGTSRKPRKGPASSPAIPSDDEIMELDFADEKPQKAKPKPRKAPQPRPSSKGPRVKAPPLPPGLSSGNDGDGEDEFWQLDD